MDRNLKVGLVLSGGGAKGAYQVGVIKALSDLGAQVDMVSGASIGALNGGVLASAPSLAEGAERLEKLWRVLAEDTPLKFKAPGYLSLLCAAGLSINGGAAINALGQFASLAAYRVGITLPAQLNHVFDSGLLCDKRLQALLDEFLDASALAHGLPLYASVYESHGGFVDLLSVMASEIGGPDTPDSRFHHVQSFPEKDQRAILLASAAIPLLFSSRKVDEGLYSDGGQGGWQKMQGNTPIQPLIQAGCNLVIVSHLSDGSLWSRDDFPDTTIVEVRPKSSIARDHGFFGGAKDLLGFDPIKIPDWIEQGYQDTRHCVERIMKPLLARQDLVMSSNAIETSESHNALADIALKDAMSRIKV